MQEAVNLSLRNLKTYPFVMDRLAKGTLKLIGARYDFVCGTFQTWNAWQLKSSENCGKMCLYIQCSVRIQWCACFKLNSNKYNGGTCTKYSAVCIRYLRSAPITWDMSHNHVNYFSCCRYYNSCWRWKLGIWLIMKKERTKGSAWSLEIRNGCG